MKLNFWPFVRKPTISFEELIADKPMPRCGEKYRHYMYTEIEGWCCPSCVAIDLREEELEAENRLVDKIAKRVIELLDQR